MSLGGRRARRRRPMGCAAQRPMGWRLRLRSAGGELPVPERAIPVIWSGDAPRHTPRPLLSCPKCRPLQSTQPKPLQSPQPKHHSFGENEKHSRLPSVSYVLSNPVLTCFCVRRRFASIPVPSSVATVSFRKSDSPQAD